MSFMPGHPGLVLLKSTFSGSEKKYFFLYKLISMCLYALAPDYLITDVCKLQGRIKRILCGLDSLRTARRCSRMQSHSVRDVSAGT
jgi:hypothetical protein